MDFRMWMKQDTTISVSSVGLFLDGRFCWPVPVPTARGTSADGLKRSDGSERVASTFSMSWPCVMAPVKASVARLVRERDSDHRGPVTPKGLSGHKCVKVWAGGCSSSRHETCLS